MPCVPVAIAVVVWHPRCSMQAMSRVAFQCRKHMSLRYAVAKCITELTSTRHAYMGIFHIWDLMGTNDGIITHIGWRHGLLQTSSLMGWTIKAVSRFLTPLLIQHCQW